MKRQADTKLNADNYDKWINTEEDQHESGPMKVADQATLNKRVIIKAKRKGGAGAGTANPFSGLSGGTVNPFSGLSSASSQNTAAPTASNKVNPFASLSSQPNASANNDILKNVDTNLSSSNSKSLNKVAKPKQKVSEMDDNTRDEKFQRAVGKLNDKFLKSIKNFIASNSCIDLKPCFDSYNKHFLHIIEIYGTESVVLNIHNSQTRDLTDLCKKLNIDLGSSSSGETDSEDEPSKKVKTMEEKDSVKSSLKQEIPAAQPVVAEKKSEEKPKAVPFSFGSFTKSNDNNSEVSSTSNPPKPSFSFGSTTSTTASTTPFTFGKKASESNSTENTTVKPFSFSNIPSSSTGSTTTGAAKKPFTFSFGQAPKVAEVTFSSQPPTQSSEPDAPSDAVPEVQEKKFETENVELEQRCKLYFNSGPDGYKERGVGTLYIKKDPETGKGQMIVRAENTTGTVLMNAMIYSNMPLKRQGKNNIIFMCPCNPEIPKFESLTDTVISYLVKVKGEDVVERVVAKITEFI